MSKLFPNQEIGSLAKPVWRIQALRGEAVPAEAYREAEALAKEAKLPDAKDLLALLKKTGPRSEAEKARIKAFSSRLAIKLHAAREGTVRLQLQRGRRTYARRTVNFRRAGGRSVRSVTAASSGRGNT